MFTVLASAARTATNNSADVKPGGKGAEVVIDMTAVPGVDTVTFIVQSKDDVSGKYSDVLTSAAIVAVSTVRLRVYPGITVAANVAVSDVLTDTWRVRAVHSAGTSFTYSVAATALS